MKRTLQDAAQITGRRTHRRGPSLRCGLHRQPDFETRLAVRRVARAELRRRGVRRRRRRRRAPSAHWSSARTPGSVPQVVVPDTLLALQELARSWRASLQPAGGRRRRQQRQDHRQGNDRRDSVAHGTVHGDARQSQQSHRRARDAHASGIGSSQRGDRDGRQPHRRRGRADADRAAHGRSHHQCRRRTSGRLRQSGRRRKGRGRDGVLS